MAPLGTGFRIAYWLVVFALMALWYATIYVWVGAKTDPTYSRYLAPLIVGLVLAHVAYVVMLKRMARHHRSLNPETQSRCSE